MINVFISSGLLVKSSASKWICKPHLESATTSFPLFPGCFFICLQTKSTVFQSCELSDSIGETISAPPLLTKVSSKIVAFLY